jgi:hypothetical protein
MSLKIYLRTLCLLVLSVFFTGCSDDVTTEIPQSSENRIISFIVNKNTYSKEFSVSENSIQGKVDSSVELDGIELDVVISDNAVIIPDPNSITTIAGPINFTVTAENGEERVYQVDLERALNDQNSILELRVTTANLSTLATIDNENNKIIQRLPAQEDFSEMEVLVDISDRATISPDISTIKNFTSTVVLTVTSESGIEKKYDVNLIEMDVDFTENCVQTNANKWLGGDNRTDAPNIDPYDRNIGTGQKVIMTSDFYPTSFGIFLDSGFKYAETDVFYNKPVSLRLNVRDVQGSLLTSTTTVVPSTFKGGIVSFNLNSAKLFLENDKGYIFQWFLIDGANLGVFTGSLGFRPNSGSDDTGFCYNSGYSGQSNLSTNSSLDSHEQWFEHPWKFNIIIEGKM